MQDETKRQSRGTVVLTFLLLELGGVPQAATAGGAEEAERKRAPERVLECEFAPKRLDKSRQPNLKMFLNDSPNGLSFLTEL